MKVSKKDNCLAFTENDADYSIEYYYHTVTALDVDWGFSLYSVGTKTIRPFVSVETRSPNIKWMNLTPDKFFLVYIADGSGFFESEYIDRRQIYAGTMFFGFPGQNCSYGPRSQTGWTEYWIEFDGSQVRNLRSNNIISAQAPIIVPGRDDGLVGIFHNIIAILKSRLLYRHYLSSLGLQLLARGLSLASSSAEHGNVDDFVVNRAMAYLNENFDREIDYEQLALDLDIAYNRFRSVFKKQTGLPLHQYLLKVRMDRARELLRLRQYTIKEIADKVGFEDPLYFSRLFKKLVGVAPSEFDWR